jgi:hypothetical protein
MNIRQRFGATFLLACVVAGNGVASADSPWDSLQEADKTITDADNASPEPPGGTIRGHGVYFKIGSGWSYTCNVHPIGVHSDREQDVLVFHNTNGLLGLGSDKHWQRGDCAQDQEEFIAGFHKDTPPQGSQPWHSSTLEEFCTKGVSPTDQLLLTRFKDSAGGVLEMQVEAKRPNGAGSIVQPRPCKSK